MPLISVLIVDDQPITRIGLKIILEANDDIDIVGEAENGEEAIVRTQELRPDVVVTDVGMPVMDGIELTKQLKSLLPEVGILVLTSSDSTNDIFAALGAGADGYCLKESSPDSICIAIRSVNQRAAWLDPAIAKRVLSVSLKNQMFVTALDKESPSSKFGLSERETQILELLVQGFNNQKMANELHLSTDTIKTHMRHIMEKLSVSDRTQVAVKALKEGLLNK